MTSDRVQHGTTGSKWIGLEHSHLFIYSISSPVRLTDYNRAIKNLFVNLVSTKGAASIWYMPT